MNDLFAAEDRNLLPHDGEAFLYTQVFSEKECRYYLQALQEHIAWEHQAITLFGKKVLQPRLTAWYGDERKQYRYSGLTLQPRPWNEELLQLKGKAEIISGTTFNSALLNLYRQGSDSMGWHRDNEPELGPTPVIASVSFGAERCFRFRNYQDKKQVISLTLPSGSLLLMKGSTQQYWQHALPKSASIQGTRINITFRDIVK